MKEQLESLFENWINPKTRDNKELAEIYSKVFKKDIDQCPKCKSKAITDLRKYYNSTYNQPKAISTGRKYVLKPGNHQFVPGERTHHNNENSSDVALAAYLKAYPYISSLFERMPR